MREQLEAISSLTLQAAICGFSSKVALRQLSDASFLIHHSLIPLLSPALYNIAMCYARLADFLEELDDGGELVRVGVTVDPILEVAEITNRLTQNGGSAILFGAVSGREIPLVTNLLGSQSRICRALGVEGLGELAERIDELLSPTAPEGWFEKMKAVPARTALGRLPPKTVKSGACQQIIKLGGDVDLDELPTLQSGRDELSPTITAGRLFLRHANSGLASIGCHDLRVLDKNRLAVCSYAHEEPARLLADYRGGQQRMPLAMVLGGDPAGLLAAMGPLPQGVDVSTLTGLLREKPVELVKCRTADVYVPTDAEIVIEGYIDPAEPPVESGPLATSGGYYRPTGLMPVMHVTALTHRSNPIYPAMVPGRWPDEISMVNRAMHRAFLPLVQAAIPELVDYDLPSFGAARHWAFVSLRKEYAGQARKVANSLWGLRQLMFVKLLVLVDEDVDVHNANQVYSAVALQVDPGRDVLFQQGPPNPFDPAAAPESLSQRIAFDATRKLPGESGKVRPQLAKMSEEVSRLVTDRWREYGIQ